jgi:hypothetical protein
MPLRWHGEVIAHEKAARAGQGQSADLAQIQALAATQARGIRYDFLGSLCYFVRW